MIIAYKIRTGDPLEFLFLFLTFYFVFGDGNGNPLQYSGLENSMDCWQATVHKVSQSNMMEVI